MYDKESFAKKIWDKSFDEVLSTIDKSGYTSFYIPKKGGKRLIHYLNNTDELLILQRKLLTRFLNKKSLPVCVKGFVPGESFISFLKEHVQNRFFMRIDIKNFFPSIKSQNIKKALEYLIICDNDEDKEKIIELIVEITTLDDELPQGAVTSPMLSNICMAHIDQRVTKYCQVFDVTYTRYADDLLFSSNKLNFKEKKWFLKKIKYILKSENYNLNYSKLKICEEQIVLNGYVIRNGEICLSRNKLIDIRVILSFIDKNKQMLLNANEEDERKFLKELNSVELKYRNLKIQPFKNLFLLQQFLCGYRSYLISLIDESMEKSSFQKSILKLIINIENKIELLNSIIINKNADK